MPDPDVPARPSNYTGGINTTYPGKTDPVGSPITFVTQKPRGDARGWKRKVRLLFSSPGEREFVNNYARAVIELQTGPAPTRIMRIFTEKLGGKNGPDTASFPMTGGYAYIPHQNINRRGAGIAVPALRTMDDSAHIPAIYAGNPPRG